MYYFFILIFIFYFVLTLASIVAILQENILYSKKDKIIKVAFVVFIPILGSIVELRRLQKYKKIKPEKYKENVDRNARVYKFVDDHTIDIQPLTNDSVI